jgi:hypothetical protein
MLAQHVASELRMRLGTLRSLNDRNTPSRLKIDLGKSGYNGFFCYNGLYGQSYEGYEGCTAKALHILGFGNTVSEVAACLNACIEPVHAEFQEQHGTSVVPIENIGIPNCCWHLKVVYTAFKLQKKPFTFKKISRERWEESLLNRCKCFLVDGQLNTSFRGRKGTKVKEQQISQLFDPEISVNGNWKHSTAVIRYKWICR